jgi:Mn-dependent DtxR family transcriptional regulator
MTLTRLQARLLVALLDSAQADLPASVGSLARQLGIRLGVAANQLAALDELGLVHAGRIRLSMAGLVVAARARVRLREASAAPLAA